MQQPNRKSSIQNLKSTDETIKETFESIVIAFILAFIFRAYVIEAFVIPTGSMAPTLLGRHVQVTCHECGYEFDVEASSVAGPNRLVQTSGARPLDTPCPMCRFPMQIASGTPTQTGDRLLVQKYMYYVAEPCRWDVVVFKNPQVQNDDGSPGPRTNYIKRLVGLPNEALQLIDGNVHVRPLDQPRSPWRIARKTDPNENRHWEQIQRAAWQPVYHSRFVPLDHGQTPAPAPAPEANADADTQEWAGDDLFQDGTARRYPWACPWRPTSGQHANWELGDAEHGWRRSYRFVPDTTQAKRQGSGALQFTWTDYHGRGTLYPYNYTMLRHGVVGRQPIEDIRLAATVVPEADGVSVELTTTGRLESIVETLIARFDPDGRVTLSRQNDTGLFVIRTAQTGKPLRIGHATPIELWFVDQELLAWVDGKVVIRQAYDLDLTQLRERAAPRDRPDVAIRVLGGPATLHAVELDRDFAYTPSLSSDLQMAPLGVMRRAASGQLLDAPPIAIRRGRYFVLGDNSPISNDGRFWNDVEPWVRQRMYGEAAGWQPTPGYPFIRDYAHVVPRGLMVGRAFFIYFPAPYAVGGTGRQILPNFGDMRFIH